MVRRICNINSYDSLVMSLEFFSSNRLCTCALSAPYLYNVIRSIDSKAITTFQKMQKMQEISGKLRSFFSQVYLSCKCIRPIDVFPSGYEHHLHIKKWIYHCNRPWWSPAVLPVRYEYHLHIESKAISVTGCGGTWVCYLWGSNIICT
jgi:hypothetical protein